MWGLFFHYIMVAKAHVTLGSIPLSWSSCATWCWVVPEIPWKWPSWAKASTRSLFSVYRVPILIPAIAKSYKRHKVINETHRKKRRHFIVLSAGDIKSLTVWHSHRAPHSTYLGRSPHYMCPLWVGQTETRPHHLQLSGCRQPQLFWLRA